MKTRDEVVSFVTRWPLKTQIPVRHNIKGDYRNNHPLLEDLNPTERAKAFSEFSTIFIQHQPIDYR